VADPDATVVFPARLEQSDDPAAAASARSGERAPQPAAGDMAFLDPLLRQLAEHSQCAAERPFVTLAYAQSVDGSIALNRARPLALSSERSFVMTHLLRSHHSALLVGINTVTADNPRLTVRLCQGLNPQPVVLDSRLRIDEDCLLFSHPDRPPWLFTTEAAPQAKRMRLQARGAAVHVLPSDACGRVDLACALRRLAELGVQRLMVEGGARVIMSFLGRGLVDYCVITVAPKLLFGGLKAMDQETGAALPALSIVPCAYQPLGGDLIIHGCLARSPADRSPGRSPPQARD
jgi:3,4-dihydroxy 2-butanone 4-phosphate synthase/GTP cyclohydrolase II